MDKAPAKKRNESEWIPLFWPKQYAVEEHDHTLEGNMLSEQKLKKYGKISTNIRSQLRDRAISLKVMPEELSGSKNI